MRIWYQQFVTEAQRLDPVTIIVPRLNPDQPVFESFLVNSTQAMEDRLAYFE